MSVSIFLTSNNHKEVIFILYATSVKWKTVVEKQGGWERSSRGGWAALHHGPRLQVREPEAGRWVRDVAPWGPKHWLEDPKSPAATSVKTEEIFIQWLKGWKSFWGAFIFQLRWSEFRVFAVVEKILEWWGWGMSQFAWKMSVTNKGVRNTIMAYFNNNVATRDQLRELDFIDGTAVDDYCIEWKVA